MSDFGWKEIKVVVGTNDRHITNLLNEMQISKQDILHWNVDNRTGKVTVWYSK
jgi:hypothetical protein